MTEKIKLNAAREYSGIKTRLLQLERFGMLCVLQYHMTPNYHKHKILLPLSYDKASKMSEVELWKEFNCFFDNFYK